MGNSNSSHNNLTFRKNDKVIDAVIYNGRYVDSRIIRKKIISAAFGIAAVLCLGVIFIF